MNWFKVLVAGAMVGVILVAFRDSENERWMVPVGPAGGGDQEEVDDEEPFLGYDGMDEDTLREWLVDADLDEEDLQELRLYEETHLAREGVLDIIDDMM